ncbi:MAG: DUF2905 domain-containing protein [bacterium JZ-2024 1]
MTETLGKILVGIGAFIALTGGIIWVGGKYLRWVGHLPGDISYRSNGFSFYFPVTTSILLSILLTVVLTLLTLIFGRRD